MLWNILPYSYTQKIFQVFRFRLSCNIAMKFKHVYLSRLFCILEKKKEIIIIFICYVIFNWEMDWYSYLIWPYCTNPITHQIMKSWSINWQLNALLRKYLTISPWYEYIFMVILHTQCLTQYYLFQKNSIESSCTLLRLWN